MSGEPTPIFFRIANAEAIARMYLALADVAMPSRVVSSRVPSRLLIDIVQALPPEDNRCVTLRWNGGIVDPDAALKGVPQRAGVAALVHTKSRPQPAAFACQQFLLRGLRVVLCIALFDDEANVFALEGELPPDDEGGWKLVDRGLILASAVERRAMREVEVVFPISPS